MKVTSDSASLGGGGGTPSSPWSGLEARSSAHMRTCSTSLSALMSVKMTCRSEPNACPILAAISSIEMFFSLTTSLFKTTRSSQGETADMLTSSGSMS